jgi:hypothetical protein
MADTNVRVTATGSYLVTIDNDNDSSAQALVVEAGNPPVARWTLHENGKWQMTDAIARGATLVLNNLDTSSFGATDAIVRFFGDVAQKVRIDKSGLGNFSLSGPASPSLTTNPNGSQSGSRGEVRTYFDGTDYYLCVNTTSGTGTSTAWVRFLLAS